MEWLTFSYFSVLEDYGSLPGPNNTHDALQGCRFADAVSSEKGNDFTSIDFYRDAIKDVAVIVVRMNIFYLQ